MSDETLPQQSPAVAGHEGGSGRVVDVVNVGFGGGGGDDLDGYFDIVNDGELGLQVRCVALVFVWCLYVRVSAPIDRTFSPQGRCQPGRRRWRCSPCRGRLRCTRRPWSGTRPREQSDCAGSSCGSGGRRKWWIGPSEEGFSFEQCTSYTRALRSLRNR